MALGKQIRHHRTRLNLTLEQLSEKSDVDVGTISALENRDSARTKFASQIAKAMSMTVEQLEDENWSPDQTHELQQATHTAEEPKQNSGYSVIQERTAMDDDELRLLRGWRAADLRDKHHIMLTIDDILKTGRAAA